MRLLRINNIDVDIDNETAIGIDFQSYDIKEPGKNFINISNTFTIPATANNKAIFGNAGNPQSLSTKIYEQATCNYWVNNEQLIKDAKVRVEEIKDRISLFIFQKDDIWDTLKSVYWFDFIGDFITWGQTYKGWESAGSPSTNSNVFINKYANTTDGIFLPMYFGNLYNYDPVTSGTYLENNATIYMKYWKSPIQSEGGHFCIYAKTIFEYIEYAYNVNFLTSGGVLPGNIWDDPLASAVYIPAKDITIMYTGTSPTSINIYLVRRDYYNSFFTPLSDQKDKEDKTLYDFVNSFMLHFNILKDELIIDNEPVIRLARFDDLETLATVKDWSGNLTGKQLFKPIIDGINQYNVIKFKEIYPEGNSLINSKVLTCLNKNLDLNQDLFDIDAYINSVIDITGSGEFIPDLSIKESFKTFTFLISTGLTTNSISVASSSLVSPTVFNLAVLKLQIPALYNLDSEYNFLDDIITYPKYYEVEKWLTLTDLKDFQFFKQYYIRELNGSFFVNKISGFNPDKSKEATKLELIKISDKTPLPVITEIDYWMDGVGDPWTDSDDDYWI